MVIFIGDCCIIGKSDFNKISLRIIAVRNSPSIFGIDFGDFFFMIIFKGYKLSFGAFNADEFFFTIEKCKLYALSIHPFLKETIFEKAFGTVSSVKDVIFNISMERVCIASNSFLVKITKIWIIFWKDLPS